MTIDQLKVYAEKNGIKLKNGQTKDVLVKKLTKAWPFKETLEKFIQDPSPRGKIL